MIARDMIPEPLQHNFRKIYSYFFKKEVSTLKWGWFKMLVNFEIKRGNLNITLPNGRQNKTNIDQLLCSKHSNFNHNLEYFLE